jgi:leukotriene-A4 hydrolase
MLRRTLLGSALATPFLYACASTGQLGAADPMAPLPHDTESYARPDEARVRHVSLDLTADFDRKAIYGTATLDVVARPDVQEIVLDSKGLQIRSITAGGRPAAYTIGDHDDEKGAPLTVALNGARQLVIDYESAPNAESLQWLEPAQTASNKRFLFSQGQAILNRTWIPTQDSPGIRQTYDARIVAPEDLKVVMSAEMLTPDGEPAGAGKRAFRFRMPQPIPPYLIAVGIGDLVHRDVGPRTGVWAEPSVIERGAYECADTERMVDVAESLRRADPAAVLPVWRHGKFASHFPHADLPRRRSQPHPAHRPRTGALLVRQPRHQRDLAGRLAQ